jgi:hypothetical protein
MTIGDGRRFLRHDRALGTLVPMTRSREGDGQDANYQFAVKRRPIVTLVRLWAGADVCTHCECLVTLSPLVTKDIDFGNVLAHHIYWTIEASLQGFPIPGYSGQGILQHVRQCNCWCQTVLKEQLIPTFPADLPW